MPVIKTHLLIISLVLFAASLACQALTPGSGAPVATQPAVATAAPQATPTTNIEPTATEAPPGDEPTATVTAETTARDPLATLPPAVAGPETLELDSLPLDLPVSDFSQGYEVAMQWTDSDEGEVKSGLTYLYRQQTTPVTGWYLLYEDSNPFFGSTIESAVVAGQGYSAATDVPCQAISADQFAGQDPTQAFRDLITALTGQAARTQAEEFVGDLITDQYALDLSNFSPGSEIKMAASAADSEGSFNSTVTSTIQLTGEGDQLESGTLHLARQGGFVARLELVYSRIAGEEDAPFAKLGTRMERRLVYEAVPARDGNAPLSPPAGCDDSGGEGDGGEGTPPAVAVSLADLPRPSDASNVIAGGETLMYQTASSVADVAAFYKQKLAALGWSLENDISMATLASLEFSQGGQTLTISVLPSGSVTMVTIVLM